MVIHINKADKVVKNTILKKKIVFRYWRYRKTIFFSCIHVKMGTLVYNMSLSGDDIVWGVVTYIIHVHAFIIHESLRKEAAAESLRVV